MSQSSSPLPLLFVAEGLLNIASGISFIASPQTLLNVSTPRGGSSLAVHSRTSLDLVQYLGALSITLGVPLLLAARDNRAAVLSRRLVYWTLLSGEVGLVAIFSLQGLADGSGRSMMDGLTPTALSVGAGMLGLIGAARAYILMAKQEWFSSADDTGRKQQ